MTALRKEARAVIAARPFAAPVAELAVPDGLTLAEMVTLAVMNGHLTRAQAGSPSLQIRIHGHVIPRAHWTRVRPRRGALIEIRIRPMGGGGGKKNPLRTILQLLVVVVVSYITAGGLGTIAGIAFESGSTAAMVAAGVASLALNALVNAIAPIPQPSQPKRSDSYTLDGARNAADPYGPCVMVLGKHRVTPRLAMRYYTEMVNESGRDVMYLYMLVQWHIGKCSLSEIKIGDTDIGTFQGVVMEHRLAGEAYSPAITLIPRVVIEEGDIQIELRGGVWNTRTTQRDTVRISFDLAWPGGLFRTEDGYYKTVTLAFAMEYRLVGAGSWTGVPLAANALYMTGVGTASYANATVDMKRKTFAWDVPAGQYEVRVRRTTADSDDRRRTDTTYWIGLRSFKAVAPVLDNQLCITALKIRASDQLNGVLDNLNAIVESHVPVWNGTNWNTVAASRNPAALYRWLFTGPAISPVRRLPASGLEADYVSAFYDYCVSKDLTCDTVIDYAASVDETAQLICGCGNGTAIASRGKRLPVIDDIKVPSQLFTSQTARNFRATINYPEEVHALRCAFANAEAGFKPDERIVYADGFSDANATKFQSAEIPGKVYADDVWYAGRRLIKRGLIRRIGYEFEVDSESLVSRYGQRILVEHFALRREAMSATVVALVGAPGAVTGVKLSEDVTMENGTLYGLQLRRGEDGTLPLFDVVNPAGPGAPVTTDTLSFTATVLEEFEPEVGDLCVWGERTLMTKDLSIIHIGPSKGDYIAALTCVPYSDDLFADDEATAPAFESFINIRQRQGIIINPVEDSEALLRRLGEAMLIATAATDDGTWTAGEKSVLVPLLKELINSQAALDTRATALGITTEKTNFDSAMSALNAYLAILVTPAVAYQWDDYAGDTEVDAATFNPLFRDAMEKRNALQAKIDELNANSQVLPPSNNRVNFSRMEAGVLGWAVLVNPGLTVTSEAAVTTSTRRSYKVGFTATASGQSFYTGVAAGWRFPVTPGEYVVPQLKCEATGPCSFVFGAIYFYDGAGAYLSNALVGLKFGTQAYGTLLEVPGPVLVPANARSADLRLQYQTSGAGAATVSIIEPMVSSGNAIVQPTPAFVPGPAVASTERAFLQSTTPAGANEGDYWTDTSTSPPIEKRLVGGVWVTLNGVVPDTAVYVQTPLFLPGANVSGTSWVQLNGVTTPALTGKSLATAVGVYVEPVSGDTMPTNGTMALNWRVKSGSDILLTGTMSILQSPGDPPEVTAFTPGTITGVLLGSTAAQNLIIEVQRVSGPADLNLYGFAKAKYE